MEAGGPPPLPTHSELPRRSPTWWLAGLGVLLVVACGVGGAIWADAQSEEYETSARVSFVDFVEPGATDAERARILALVPDLGPEPIDVAGGEAWVDLPEGRNFIDVYGRAAQAEAAEAIADDVASQLVAAEEADRVRRVDAELARAQTGFDSLQQDIDDLAAEMEVFLAQEAEAEGRRRDAEEGAQVEAAVTDARVASEQYWELARRRNALIDEQTRFEREIARFENDRLIPSDLELTAPAAEAQLVFDLSPVAGFAGGAAAALGFLLLVWALITPVTER